MLGRLGVGLVWGEEKKLLQSRGQPWNEAAAAWGVLEHFPLCSAAPRAVLIISVLLPPAQPGFSQAEA